MGFFRRKKTLDLLSFERERQFAPEPEKTVKVKDSWSSASSEMDEPQKRLARLIRSSELLKDLSRHAGWAEVLEARNFWLRVSDSQIKNLSLDERMRLVALCDWHAIQGFFAELDRRIKKGEEAREEMKETQEKFKPAF